MYDFSRPQAAGAGVTVLVVAGGAGAYYSAARAEPYKWRQVGGVGDKAIAITGSLYVMSGQYAFTVECIPANAGITLGDEPALGRNLASPLRH